MAGKWNGKWKGWSKESNLTSAHVRCKIRIRSQINRLCASHDLFRSSKRLCLILRCLLFLLGAFRFSSGLTSLASICEAWRNLPSREVITRYFCTCHLTAFFYAFSFSALALLASSSVAKWPTGIILNVARFLSLTTWATVVERDWTGARNSILQTLILQQSK